MAPKALKILDLPISGAGCGDIRISSPGNSLRVEFDHFEKVSGEPAIGALHFESVAAFRFRDEMHSRGFAAESYDSVVLLPDSPWISELAEMEPKFLRTSVLSRRHFAVFLSNNGYLEVVAEEVQLEVPTPNPPTKAS